MAPSVQVVRLGPRELPDAGARGCRQEPIVDVIRQIVDRGCGKLGRSQDSQVAFYVVLWNSEVVLGGDPSQNLICDAFFWCSPSVLTAETLLLVCIPAVVVM